MLWSSPYNFLTFTKLVQKEQPIHQFTHQRRLDTPLDIVHGIWELVVVTLPYSIYIFSCEKVRAEGMSMNSETGDTEARWESGEAGKKKKSEGICFDLDRE